ncbi:putative RNA-directed DNA polymerase from transposon BS [Trichonephila clavipes]|nr:putative RNA-directed DNA polymerase from transposon BS [Trichonephila clavipes]
MNEHLPVCVALQETLLKPSCTSNKRGYSILRKDSNMGERACGGVALLINHATPFCPFLIRTSLQAVAVQVSIFSTVTICNVYLPPNAPLNFRELQELIDNSHHHSSFWVTSMLIIRFACLPTTRRSWHKVTNYNLLLTFYTNI